MTRPKHRNLPLLLLQARESVLGRFRPILNANRVTEQQWRIMRVLIEAESLEPRQIGDLCRISSPSLAGVLARMQQLGFVARKRIDQDRRRMRVELTARGRALVLRMLPQVDATYERIERTAGREFCERLYRALDQLIGALEVEPAAAPRPPRVAARKTRP